MYAAVAGKARIFITLYLVLAYVGGEYLGWLTGNRMNPILYISLSLAVLSSAYTLPSLANRILCRNDISYGVYIWHMPVVNALLFLGITNTISSLGIMLAMTVVTSGLSWFFVEKPAMRFKRHPLNPLYKGTQDSAIPATGDK